jgi:hypothetical protein
MYCYYSKKTFTGRAKLFRIIGDPDNQRQNKWNYIPPYIYIYIYTG